MNSCLQNTSMYWRRNPPKPSTSQAYGSGGGTGDSLGRCPGGGSGEGGDVVCEGENWLVRDSTRILIWVTWALLGCWVSIKPCRSWWWCPSRLHWLDILCWRESVSAGSIVWPDRSVTFNGDLDPECRTDSRMQFKSLLKWRIMVGFKGRQACRTAMSGSEGSNGFSRRERGIVKTAGGRQVSRWCWSGGRLRWFSTQENKKVGTNTGKVT